MSCSILASLNTDLKRTIFLLREISRWKRFASGSTFKINSSSAARKRPPPIRPVIEHPSNSQEQRNSLFAQRFEAQGFIIFFCAAVFLVDRGINSKNTHSLQLRLQGQQHLRSNALTPPFLNYENVIKFGNEAPNRGGYREADDAHSDSFTPNVSEPDESKLRMTKKFPQSPL